MKKLSIIITLVLLSTAMFGQRREVVSAFNYLRHDKLDKAKEAIDKAIQDEKTKDDAKTWFYRGNIYLQLGVTDKEEFQNIAEKPLLEAFQSYMKAMELDEKDEYTIDIDQNIRFIGQEYYNQGATLYNENDYINSAQNFLMSYNVYQEVGRTDTVALLNYALAANQGGDPDNAIGKLEQLMEWKYDDPTVYEAATNIYLQKGKVEKAIEAVNLGREAFPDNYPLLLAEINLYMSTQQPAKAIDAMKYAVKQDSLNYTIWRAMGDMYDKMAEDTTVSKEKQKMALREAQEAYKKAIEINPEYFDAYYNLGALYVNEAAEVQQMANDLPLDKVDEYNAMKAEADSLLGEALPHLEAALEIDPEDRNTMYSLKEIYTRLGQLEKAKEINMMLQE